MKKLLVIIGVILLGAVIMTGVDVLLGISFVNTGPLGHALHVAALMAWGGVLYAVIQK